MKRAIALAVPIVALAAFLAAAAPAALIRAGNVVVRADAGFSPTALPKRAFAPITLAGSVSASTVDGSVPPPLRTIVLDFDRNGKLETQGLPVCRLDQLTNTTPAQARSTCADAIVGTGLAKAVVTFPDAAPIPVRSPITIFNGPAEQGDPTVIFHAYTTIPAPTTITIVARIRKKSPGGVYGYDAVTQVPPLVGGNGALTAASIEVSRLYRSGGRSLSFISARCATGVLGAHGEFDFEDGTIVSGTVFKPCRVRG